MSKYLSELRRELKQQLLDAYAEIRTKEFWVYFSLIVVFVLIFFAFLDMSLSFDFVTKSKLNLTISCKTGQGQMATIIVGLLVLMLACLFTLGQVVHWGEENRQLKKRGRTGYKPLSFWKPMLHILGTVVLGLVGYLLLRSWCL